MGQARIEGGPVPMAALWVLPVVFAGLTVMVWWLGSVRLVRWVWPGSLSAVVGVAGGCLPARGEPRLARWLLRARNALGLVLVVNVLFAVGCVVLVAATLRMPLG